MAVTSKPSGVCPLPESLSAVDLEVRGERRYRVEAKQSQPQQSGKTYPGALLAFPAGHKGLAQVPGMGAVRGDGARSRTRTERGLSVLPSPHALRVPCCCNQLRVPAGPSVPRGVPGRPPHLQVKRARYRCKSSSPAPLSSPVPSAVALIFALLHWGFSSVHLCPSAGSSYL